MFDKYFKEILAGLLFLIVCGLFSISAQINGLNKTIDHKKFYESGVRYIDSNNSALNVRIIR